MAAPVPLPVSAPVTWPDVLYDTLKRVGIDQVGHVPDAGHARLIDRCEHDPGIAVTGLTSEEEGVGLAAGAWLGGQRAALLMQSSGLGNCINAIASLAEAGQFPLLMIITMRGEWGEFNPWQVPLGRATRDVLVAVDCRVLDVHRPDDVADTTLAAARLAFDSSQRVAVLLTQRLIGTKAFR